MAALVRNILTTRGRIFVMGDLHGQIILLTRWLAWVEFDYENDILLSVGDLIDRGYNSLACTQLIYQSWFHACHSNHGQLFQRSMSIGSDDEIHSGGDWMRGLLEDQALQQNARDMSALPIVINIRNRAGELFHIMHAELNDGSVTGDNLQDEEFMRQWYAHDLATAARGRASILWGREQFNFIAFRSYTREQAVRAMANHAGGVEHYIAMQNNERGHIVSGHTIMVRPTTIMGQTCIDTGPAEDRSWSGLTFMNLDTGEFTQSGLDGVHVIQALTITQADLI